MPSLHDLPNELLFLISSILSDERLAHAACLPEERFRIARRALCGMSQMSRKYRAIFQPELYRCLDSGTKDKRVSFLFWRTIDKRPDLAIKVEKLYIHQPRLRHGEPPEDTTSFRSALQQNLPFDELDKFWRVNLWSIDIGPRYDALVGLLLVNCPNLTTLSYKCKSTYIPIAQRWSVTDILPNIRTRLHSLAVGTIDQPVCSDVLEIPCLPIMQSLRLQSVQWWPQQKSRISRLELLQCPLGRLNFSHLLSKIEGLEHFYFQPIRLNLNSLLIQVLVNELTRRVPSLKSLVVDFSTPSLKSIHRSVDEEFDWWKLPETRGPDESEEVNTGRMLQAPRNSLETINLKHVEFCMHGDIMALLQDCADGSCPKLEQIEVDDGGNGYLTSDLRNAFVQYESRFRDESPCIHLSVHSNTEIFI